MELIPIEGIPEVRPGDDIASLITERVSPEPTDIVLVASTIVSKAEDRGAGLGEFPAGPRAVELASRLSRIAGEEKDPRFAQAVLEESTEIIIEAPFLLTATRFGHICVNAGIDRSNTGGAELLLLPRRPTRSAARIRAGLSATSPVVVTDTAGRPFRLGQRGVAIGWDGIPASRDWRGEPDREGRPLSVTVEAVVDELAAAANLVSGEGAGGTPVVIARNADLDEFEPRDELFRPVDRDVVRAALREWTWDPDGALEGSR